MYFDEARRSEPFSVRKALAGKNVLLIGVTGFIGKVWLANTLMDLPEIGKDIPARSGGRNPIRRTSASRRWWKNRRYSIRSTNAMGEVCGIYQLTASRWLRETSASPGWVSHPKYRMILLQEAGSVINSSGLTDFNPDLRDALATNVDAAVNILDFVRRSAPLPLCCISPLATWRETATAASARNCGPTIPRLGVADFDAEREWRALHEVIATIEQKPESAGSHGRAPPAGAEQGSCGKGSARRSAGEPDPQEPGALAQELFDGSRNQAGAGIGLAEYLHAD